MAELRVLRDGGHFFEGPRWHDGLWWVSDFYSHTVGTVAQDGTATARFEVPGQPSGLGWLPDGQLLVSSMLDRRVLRRDHDGVLHEHADLAQLAGGPVNDLVVDGAGRAWVGNFGYDLMGGGTPAPATLVRVDPDGTVVAAADDLWFPNGSVVLADGRTLVVAETVGRRCSAFTIADDGTLTDRRVWAPLSTEPRPGPYGDVVGTATVSPDGCSADAEDRLWIADAAGGRVVRVAEGGAVLAEVALPDGLAAYACMLGGDDGRTLLVCAAPDHDHRARAAATEAVLLTTRVEVPHAGLP
jgi:sugar lactone lactonase YvrE